MGLPPSCGPCCDDICSSNSNCDATISWEFTIAGVSDDVSFCCSDVNTTYTLTGTTPVWSETKSGTPCSYSFNYELDWANFADLDIFVLIVKPFRVTIYWGNLSSDLLELNHNAHPTCHSTPLSPETISSTSDYTDSRFFQMYYALSGNCAFELVPDVNLLTIKNNGSDDILVRSQTVIDGVFQPITSQIVASGDSFFHNPEYAGNPRQPIFYKPKEWVDVDCCEDIRATLYCPSSDWWVSISRRSLEVARYKKATELDCCNDQVFTLVSNTDQCTGWPSTITLTPSGATCP